MGEFFCPDCGEQVESPHFCGCNPGGLEFNITIPLGVQKPESDIPSDPYAEQKAHFQKQLDDYYITQEEYDNQMRHIERCERLYQRLNGKEKPDGVDS